MQLRSLLRLLCFWKRWKSNKTTISARTVQEQCVSTSKEQCVSDQKYAQSSPCQSIGEVPRLEAKAPRSSQASTEGQTPNHSLEYEEPNQVNQPALYLPQAQSPLPNQPSDIDLLYSMNRVSMDPTFGSPEDLVCPVIPDNRSSLYDLRPSAPLTDPMAGVINNDGAFRHIHVRFDGDETGARARVQCIMHDTGSACSLTFESKLRALGMNFRRFDEKSPGPYMRAVNGESFRAIGERLMEFSYYDIKHKTHWVHLYVLADQNRGPAYDMLFGRDLLSSVGALKWDHTVIGINAIT